jgi:H+/Cl- antiporter ClcA
MATAENSKILEEYSFLFKFTIRWLLLGSFVGVLSGLAVAAFIFALRVVTDFRIFHLWIISFLPLAGVATGYLYRRFGHGSEEGSDLIIDEVLEFRGRVLFRMGPLVVIATLLAHLFGGSAGREATAVQLGGALASKLARMLKLVRQEAQMLMMAGISGGFSAIFGTPVAGAIFGMEVISRGEIRFASAIACVASAIAGSMIGHQLTPVHENYHVPLVGNVDLLLIAKLLFVAMPFAFASAIFSELTHWIARRSKVLIPNELLRPAIGGLIIVLLLALFQDSRYLGLSLPFVDGALNGHVFPGYTWAVKILFTSLTLGFGFRGGDVFPLFVIGALLGSSLAPLLNLNPAMLGAIGFVAVFASASKTPISATIMGIEIFGASYAVPFVLVNFVGYMLAGHSGIFVAQRRTTFGFEVPEETAIAEEIITEAKESRS